MIKKLKINLQKTTLLISALLCAMCIFYVNANAVQVVEELSLRAGQIVNKNDKVNVLTAPSSTSKIVGTVSKGSYVTITMNEQNGFYRVQYKDGLFGYVASENIKLIPSETKFILNGPQDVRSGPGSNYQKIGSVENKELILILSTEKNGWYKILYKGSTIGYVLDSKGNELRPTHIVFDSTFISKPLDIIKVGNTLKYIATAIPLEAKDRQLYWSSTNEKIATVDSNGVVTGKSAGEVQIVAKTSNGVTASRKVRVVNSAGEEAAKRANYYLVNYGAGTKNAAIYATDNRKMYLEAGYKDYKRYADTSSFPWFCYTYTGVNLGANKTYPTIEEMAKNPGEAFKSYSFRKVSDLKVGDLVIWINYNRSGSDYVAIYVGKDRGTDYFIDMGPKGIQKRSLNTLVKELGNKQPTNYVTCIK